MEEEQHHDETTAHIEKLLKTIERLRGERDHLLEQSNDTKRLYDFHKAETRFTIETLQHKVLSLSRSGTIPEHPPTLKPIRPPNHLQNLALVSTLVIQHLSHQNDLCTTKLDDLSQQFKFTNTRLQKAEQTATEREKSLKRLQDEDMHMRDTLTTAEVRLANAETRVKDLDSVVERLQEELEHERGSHNLEGDSLARAQARITELGKSLANAESERDSFSLRVTHLEQDLENARTELKSTEERYSTLQTQQLASMSHRDATRTLKTRVEELEARVLRRTEQIGIHQHDVKRLELNLRLQEERVADLSGELEVMENEKLAMVEDCRTTREERDQALRRCEELEEGMEAIEGDRERETMGMVGVVADAVSARRKISRVMLSMQTATLAQLENARQSEASVLCRVEQLEGERANLMSTSSLHSSLSADHARLVDEHSQTVSRLHDYTEKLRASEVQANVSQEETRRATVALAVLRRDLHIASIHLREARSNSSSLNKQLEAVRQDLHTKAEELIVLHAAHDRLKEQDAQSNADAEVRHMQQVAELGERCAALKSAKDELEAGYQQALNDLTKAREELDRYTVEGEERLQSEKMLQVELENAQATYQAEAAHLRAELTETREQLEDAKLKQAEMVSSHRQVVEDRDHLREELQGKLEEALEKLKMEREAQGELADVRRRYEEELEVLKERLAESAKSLEELTRTHDDLAGEHAKASVELDQRREQMQGLVRAREELEVEWEGVKVSSEAEVKSLERRVEDLAKEVDEGRAQRNDLEIRNDELKQRKEEAEEQLEKANAEVEQLRVELRSSVDQHAQVDGQLVAELDEARKRAEEAEKTIERIRAECEDVRARLMECEGSLEDVKREKERMEEEMTGVEAERQKALSMARFHESRVQETQRELDTLRSQFEHTQAQYIQAEQAAKANEISLELQTVQHENVVAKLKEEVQMLKKRGESEDVLEETVREMTERNEEMEDMLKEKCREIEENDDRFMELIKEKKKLNSKVESLTRKVKGLQEKLSKEAGSDATPLARPLPTVSAALSVSTSVGGLGSSTSTPTITQPPISLPVVTQPEPVTAPAPSSSTTPMLPQKTPNSSTSVERARSVSRPKTPESRRPVFKARTPEVKRQPITTTNNALASSSSRSQPQPKLHYEKGAIPTQAEPPMSMGMSMTTTSTIGKKRRAPEDFEDCESVPPQVFTADSVPSGYMPSFGQQENDYGGSSSRTPRHRRGAAKIGFTPVRGGSGGVPSSHALPGLAVEVAQEHGQGQTSPRRATTGGPVIADVTNSPRSKSGPVAAGGKRGGWLGKIRGGGRGGPGPVGSSAGRSVSGGHGRRS